MTFVQPLAWLVGIPVAAIVVALYLLKMRRKELKVPASFLWPATVYEIRANSLFQKLKFSWLLFLQLLALTLLALALVQPQVTQRALGGSVVVVVIDVSASMSAEDMGGSRFAAAKKAAAELVSGIGLEDRLAVIEAGATPRVVSPLSSDKAKIRRSLETIQPTDAECDMAEALRLAATLTAKRRDARILLLSDGDFAEVENFSPPDGTELVFQKYGTTGKNLAVSALGLAPAGKGLQLFVGVKNFGLDSHSGRLTLYADGSPFDSFDVQVRSGQTPGWIRAAPNGVKVVEARLQADEPLQSDNYAVALANPGAMIKVLLVGPGDLFLERALSLDPRVLLDKAAKAPASGSWDIVVFDGVAEQPVSAKSVLALGVAGTSPIVKSTGELTKPLVRLGQPASLLNDVDIDTVYIERAERLVEQGATKVLATFDSGSPAIVASEAGGKRRIHVAFRPQKSDFPLQVGFPIFVANAIDYLTAGRDTSTDLVVAAGRTFPLSADSEHPLRLSGPTGEHDIRPTRGRYVVREAKKVGTYRLGARKLYATLRSDVESEIAPRDSIAIAGTEVKDAGTVLRLTDVWPWVVAVALVTLAGEWWLFVRRS